MRDLVKKLRKKYTVAVLSNDNDVTFRMFEKKYGLPRLFEGHVVSGRVGVAKPDPKIFQIMLKQFNKKPEETIFIDNTQGHVDSAKT